MPDILRKAVPLKLPDWHHRLAERVAPCDFPRWCVRHALRMLTSVCRGGVPAPSRNPLSGAPLSRLILDFACAFAHTTLARIARPRWGVRRCADLAFHPLTSPAAGAFMPAYRHRPATHCQKPDPYGQCRTHIRDTCRAHAFAQALGCTEVYGFCTGVYGFRTAATALRRTHPHATLVGPQGEATTVFHDTSSLGGIGDVPTHVRQRRQRVVPVPVTRLCESIGDSLFARLLCTDDDRRGLFANIVNRPLSGALRQRKPTRSLSCRLRAPTTSRQVRVDLVWEFLTWRPEQLSCRTNSFRQFRTVMDVADGRGGLGIPGDRNASNAAAAKFRSSTDRAFLRRRTRGLLCGGRWPAPSLKRVVP